MQGRNRPIDHHSGRATCGRSGGKGVGFARTESSVDLVGLGRYKKTGAAMLGAEFVKQFVLDFGQMSVGLAGDRNRLGLVFGGMHFDEVL